MITASRSQERNEEYAARLRARGLDVSWNAGRYGECESIDGLHAEVSSRFGPPDIFVKDDDCATAGRRDYRRVQPESLYTTARADVVGFVWMCKQFCADMARRAAGSVINIASVYRNGGERIRIYTPIPK